MVANLSLLCSFNTPVHCYIIVAVAGEDHLIKKDKSSHYRSLTSKQVYWVFSCFVRKEDRVTTKVSFVRIPPKSCHAPDSSIAHISKFLRNSLLTTTPPLLSELLVSDWHCLQQDAPTSSGGASGSFLDEH